MRRAVVGLLVLALVAVGIAVAVDRYVLARTERRVVEELAAAGLDLSPDAQVSIAGFPFLTQVWSGRIGHAVLTADGATVEALPLTDVDVTAEGITTSVPATVERLVVTATAPASTLTDAVARSALAQQGFEVSIAIEDAQVRAMTSVLGLPVEVGLVPEPAGREIALSLVDFSLGGFSVDAADLPRALREGLAAVRVPLDGMPEGLEVTQTEVHPDGLRITLTGSDVPLEDLAAAPAGTP